MKCAPTLIAFALLTAGCREKVQTSKPEPAPERAGGTKYQLKTFGNDLLMFRPGTGETWAFNPKTRDWIALPKPRAYVQTTEQNDPLGHFTNRIKNDTTAQKP